MRPITTSTYSFPDVIGNGFVYVDKTAGIRELLRDGKNQYFCARPRRFGKSLLVSTLRCVFEGRRDLFRGLAIDRSDYEWKTYPVILLDMGSCQSETVEGFRLKLTELLSNEAARNGVTLEPSPEPSILLSRLIRSLAARSETGKTVLLLDEYDKPLLGRLGTPEVTKFKDALKDFYSVIKTLESFQRFAFMTGVSKFSKVSIFSDLNNLTDITMDARYATLFGYTHEEVKEFFPEHLAALAEANGLTGDEVFAKLEEMYDGFKFHPKAERVFNPVSVGKCLVEQEFRNYWFETGTPTFLVDLLKREPLAMGDLHATVDDLSAAYEPEQVRMLPLMVQTGYLTIKSSTVDGRVTDCELGYPNGEVEEAMSEHLARAYSCLRGDDFGDVFREVCDGLRAGDPDAVLAGVKCFFENIPYDLHMRYEKYYQSLFVSIFLMLKARVSSEVKTARGRIDAVVETANFVYIFEFKIRGTSEEAMAQIEERGYAAKYAADPRRIFKVGCAFDWDKRNLGTWIVA